MSADATRSRAAMRVSMARAQSRVPILQLLVLVALYLYGTSTIDGLSSRSSILSMLVLAAFLGIASLGQTLVVLLGGIDLSIAAYLLAGNVLTARLLGQEGWSPVTTFGLIFLVAVVGGGATGYLCSRLRANPLVVTLGTAAIISGITIVLFGSTSSGPLPQWLVDVSSVTGKTFGVEVPSVVVMWAALAVIVGVVLSRTRAGRNLYATGTKQPAAELALVRTHLVWAAVFALSALSAAFTGVLLTGFGGGANFTVGEPYLFTSLTAVIAGGVSYIGARGSYWNTCIGALILTLLTTILIGRGYDAADTQIVYGALIFVFVGLYARSSKIRDRI